MESDSWLPRRSTAAGAQIAPHPPDFCRRGGHFFIDFSAPCSSLFLIVLFLCYVEVTGSHDL